MKRQKETVRRNITLNRCVANELETMSRITGRTQSKILESALRQPIMQRLYAFVSAIHEDPYFIETNPLSLVMNSYQMNEGDMNPRTGEYIIRAAKNWFEDYAAIKDRSVLANDSSYVNDYISGHITYGLKEADPYFEMIYEQAENDLFVTSDIKADEFKAKIVKYMDIMLANPEDKRLMGESYLFRNLSVILSECFKAPTVGETANLFKELSDGYVLPVS